VDSNVEWVIPLAKAADVDEGLIGGKAAKLAQLARAGFQVPDGFCITAPAYIHFVRAANLDRVIRMELGRKPFEAMRWEEIWDAALRIRAAFLSAPIPARLAQAITAALEKLAAGRPRTGARPLVVRSSAPGEDAADRSFAGLHESVVGVTGLEGALDAVRVVWASLWSDAALLYRQELSLDPAHSQMAVVVQEMIDEDRSGVAFGRDPREPQLDRAIVEAVPGPCSDLVDGLVDPDRWILDRSSGDITEWRPGDRGDAQERQPLLAEHDLDRVWRMLNRVESLFQWPPDTEWTGRGEQFTLLQARPITTVAADPDDQRGWYLSLRPGMQRLRILGQRVAYELIPELERLGERFASEAIDSYGDGALASAIEERFAAVQKWRQIYLEDFIPFAHGVRQLGTYYNDAVRPDDPYEFVGLLRGERMVASQRNQALQELAEQVAANQALEERLRQAADLVTSAPERIGGDDGGAGWQNMLESLKTVPGGDDFAHKLESLLAGFMDVAYEGQRLADRPDLILRMLLEMAGSPQRTHRHDLDDHDTANTRVLEQRLMDAVGEARQEEAGQVLAIGRLSWRLRDDDNVLVGRLESQLLRALQLAAARLQAADRLRPEDRVGIEASPIIVDALRHPSGGLITLPAQPESTPTSGQESAGEAPRQLVGQPAAPGLATGQARWVRHAQDLGRFRAGEVLVCDAIQPTMTHLVPLSAAIIERRGGMLIHGAIIARELGIPCVNGIANALDLLRDGDPVTVDGYLGIVTVGPPEFDLEIGI
jgi:pyruvate,water dikinase